MTVQNTASNVAPRKSLADSSLTAAITAVAGSEKAFFSATVSIATVMVAGQVDRLTGELAIDKAKNKSLFKAFLKRYAAKGHVVWVGSEEGIETIKSTVGRAARETAASNYIDKKVKGSRLSPGLARLQTSALNVANDVCDKFPDLIREIATIRESGGDSDAQISRFERHVTETYGDSAARIAAFFAKPPVQQSGEAPIEKANKVMLALTDLDLATLYANIAAEMERRKAEMAALAEAESAFDDEDETDGEADGAVDVTRMSEAA